MITGTLFFRTVIYHRLYWLMTKTPRLLSALLFIGFLATGHDVAGEGESLPGQLPAAGEHTVETERLARQPATARTVVAVAELQPLLFTKLSFERDGQIAEILVKTGDSVAAGQSLIRLDSTQAELDLVQVRQQLIRAEAAQSAAESQVRIAQARVNSAQEQVTLAQAQLDLLRSGPRPEEVAAAEARLAAANAAVSAAFSSQNSMLNGITGSAIQAGQTNLAMAAATRHALEVEYETILTTCYQQPDGSEICPYYGTVEEQTRARLEAARINEAAAQATLAELQSGPTHAERQVAGSLVTNAVANRDIAAAQRDLLMAPAGPEEIVQAELAIEWVEVNVRLAETAVQQAEAAVARTETAVARSQIAVSAAEAELEQFTLRAPFNGLIAQLDAHRGETIAGGAPLLTVADTGHWVARTLDLSQLEVVGIVPGNQARLRLDAIPEQTISGSVLRIRLTPQVTERDIFYEVLIQLDDLAGLPLRWGMTGLVEIEGEAP